MGKHTRPPPDGCGEVSVGLAPLSGESWAFRWATSQSQTQRMKDRVFKKLNRLVRLSDVLLDSFIMFLVLNSSEYVQAGSGASQVGVRQTTHSLTLVSRLTSCAQSRAASGIAKSRMALNDVRGCSERAAAGGPRCFCSPGCGRRASPASSTIGRTKPIDWTRRKRTGCLGANLAASV